jgi:hypothetical protein
LLQSLQGCRICHERAGARRERGRWEPAEFAQGGNDQWPILNGRK